MEKIIYSKEEKLEKEEKKNANFTQKGKSLIDSYNLRQPGKEYYEKYKKYENLFKEILDINYILKEKKFEKLKSLPSSKMFESKGK